MWEVCVVAVCEVKGDNGFAGVDLRKLGGVGKGEGGRNVAVE